MRLVSESVDSVNCPRQCGQASSKLSRTEKNKRQRKEDFTFFLPHWQSWNISSHLLWPSHWDLHHEFPQFSGIWTHAKSQLFWVSSYSSSLHNHINQVLTVNLLLETTHILLVLFLWEILIKNGEKGPLCLVLKLKGKAFSFSLLSMMQVFMNILYQVEEFLPYSQFAEIFILNRCITRFFRGMTCSPLSIKVCPSCRQPQCPKEHSSWGSLHSVPNRSMM